MKRTLLIALSLFLSLSMAFSGGLVLESETPGFRIYDQTGRSMPDETVMDDAMYIILNEEEDAVLNSDFGTITLKPDTILGITSLDVEAPSFYLVSGYAEIDLKARMRVDFPTPEFPEKSVSLPRKCSLTHSKPSPVAADTSSVAYPMVLYRYLTPSAYSITSPS